VADLADPPGRATLTGSGGAVVQGDEGRDGGEAHLECF
jgi:hypothetical protein